MPIHITRRGLALGLLTASVIPLHVAANDGGKRLPDLADLWSRLPLPFTPAEAWVRLPPAAQAEIGAAVIGMALADYIAGDCFEEEDKFLDDGLRSDASDAFHSIFNAMPDRLWGLFPELYGPDGDHPRWALAGGFAR